MKEVLFGILSIIAEWLKNEPVVVGEFTKVVIAAGILFGLPVDPALAGVVAAMAYTLLTLVVRHFTTAERTAVARETAALYGTPAA